MPEIAANTTEAILTTWAVPEGGAFAAGDTLVAVETEKANVDVPAETAGVLLRRLVDEGTRLEVGSPIALLGAVGEVVEDVDRALFELGLVGATAVGRSSTGTPGVAVEWGSPRPVEPGVSRDAGGAPQGERLFASPVARRLARDAGVDLADLTGTGPGGRIRKRDVEGLIARRIEPVPALGAPVLAPPQPALAPTSAPKSVVAIPVAPAATLPPGAPVEFPNGADEVLVPMTRMRKGIAAKMTRALLVPHAYVHMEVDATTLVRARESAKREFQAREGISLSYVPFVIKAVVEALHHYPTFNSHWTEAGLLAKRHIHMGVAVAVDDGLLVPVVRDVDQLSISGLNRAIYDVAARARAGKLRLDDYGGSTFTIDNTGWFGSNLTMPIINVPEVAILTMEAITKRAVVRETSEGDVIAIRPVMNMVLAIDHRANDGAQAAAFLRTIKASLEAIGP
ncbi:MAG TPA: dihydrolipoamide acetyltransferase family protein, partial [Candidatus Limnocylindrales bacterium]